MVQIRKTSAGLTEYFYLSGREKVRWGKQSLNTLSQVSFSDVAPLECSWSASDILLLILNDEWYYRKMGRHNTCSTTCSWWCLFLSQVDLGPEKYSYTITSSSELPAILMWLGSQSRAISPPQSSLWRKSLGETKRFPVYELSECCKLKGETQQEAFISRMTVAAGCKGKASFLWGVWRAEVCKLDLKELWKSNI